MTQAREIKIDLKRTMDIDYSDFDSIRKEMADIEAAHPEYTRFAIYMESEPYDDSNRQYPHVYGYRMESDAELAARVAKESAALTAREARERAEFERLSALYGKS